MTNSHNDLGFEARLRRSLERAAPEADPRLAERLLTRTAAEPQRRAWSFFSGLGPALATAAIAAVAVIAGLALSGLPRNVGTPTPSATPSFAPTSSASPSAAPATNPTPTEGTTSSVSPSASPAALHCTNERMGFEVAYPADWHTNEEVEQQFGDPVPACTYFGEVPMDIAPNTGLPSTVAIIFDRQTGPSPEVTSAELISREETTVSGRPGTATEWRFTEDSIFHEAGDRVAIYEIELGEGSILLVSTNPQANGNYEDHRRVLEGMIESLALE